MYATRLSRKARKDLKELSKSAQLKKKIILAVAQIQIDPEMGKKLTGKASGFRTIRVWPYRIVYQILAKAREIYIVRIAHRQGAYSGF